MSPAARKARVKPPGLSALDLSASRPQRHGPPSHMFSMAALQQQLEAALQDNAQPVTARWLCFKHGVDTAQAQDALRACVNSDAAKVAVTYLLTGTLFDMVSAKDKQDAPERLTLLRQARCLFMSTCGALTQHVQHALAQHARWQRA